MNSDEFYKNKPANVVKIINDRVWRYTGTDHTSGAVYCHYYFGGETSANLCDFFIRMMSPKADIGKDPIRGVPKLPQSLKFDTRARCTMSQHCLYLSDKKS